MSDDELVTAFEAATLPVTAFSHAGHVRAAWWYLNHYPLPEALARFSAALRRFAAAHGAPGKYHETITVAYMLLIAERVADTGETTWQEFAERNPDLLARDPSPLAKYYSPEVLASERARIGFVMPDRVTRGPGQ